MTKDESIIETPRDSPLESYSGSANEVFIPNIFSNNRSQCVQNFHTQTNLSTSVLPNPLQTKSSKGKKSDFNQFYDNIKKDVMSDFLFRDSQNPEFQHLHKKLLCWQLWPLQIPLIETMVGLGFVFSTFVTQWGTTPWKPLTKTLSISLSIDQSIPSLQTC